MLMLKISAGDCGMLTQAITCQTCSILWTQANPGAMLKKIRAYGEPNDYHTGTIS